jgi:oligopeptide transport system ATP-binding protein
MFRGLSNNGPILSVRDLSVRFHTREGIVRAVDGVSFDVNPGETLGIVGESGSGKSVLCYSLLGLIPVPPGRIENGSARFDGTDLLHGPDERLRSIRGKRIAMIFQDPMTALNPYMTVGRQVMEPLLVHEGCTANEARARAVEALTSVGIQDAPARLNDYPHLFSGGMRQRVMIAMALITRPALLIADEPTTALDVTVQSQILELISTMQRERNTAVILVTHNLGVVARTCDRVLVTYAGRILESAPLQALFHETRHPYTKALMAAMPSVHEKGETLYTIPGMPPDLMHEIAGCPFTPRCAHAVERCKSEPVALREVSPGHATACWRAQAGEL